MQISHPRDHHLRAKKNKQDNKSTKKFLFGLTKAKTENMRKRYTNPGQHTVFVPKQGNWTTGQPDNWITGQPDNRAQVGRPTTAT